MKELVSFFVAARSVDGRYFLQVWTQGDASVIVRELQAQGVPSEVYAVGFAAQRDVPRLIQAADAGLSFIRHGPSTRSRSPTKVGEYLAAGLPVVSTAGIGDCDKILNGTGLGLIVRSHDHAEYCRAAEALTRLLNDRDTATRCRTFAAEQLSIEQVAGPRYAAIYRRLLDAPSGTSRTPA